MTLVRTEALLLRKDGLSGCLLRRRSSFRPVRRKSRGLFLRPRSRRKRRRLPLGRVRAVSGCRSEQSAYGFRLHGDSRRVCGGFSHAVYGFAARFGRLARYLRRRGVPICSPAAAAARRPPWAPLCSISSRLCSPSERKRAACSDLCLCRPRLHAFFVYSCFSCRPRRSRLRYSPGDSPTAF